VVKDETGKIVELHCTYDPETKSSTGGDSTRRVKGTLHWVSASHAIPAEVRLYDYLFTVENPDDEEDGMDFKSKLNPNSLIVLNNCRLEPSLSGAKPGDRFQFLRQGYFCMDPDSSPNMLVFNRIVNLRDTWAKMQKSEG